jgi:hypothetical protein
MTVIYSRESENAAIIRLKSVEQRERPRHDCKPVGYPR